jgi:manganese transport protein
MGTFAIGPWVKTGAWLAAVIILSLNFKLVVDTVGEWIASAGAQRLWIQLLLFPILGGIAALLAWIAFEPFVDRFLVQRLRKGGEIHRAAEVPVITLPEPEPLRRVAIALDFSGREVRLIEGALRFLTSSRPVLALFHVVESASARAFGSEAADQEMVADQERLEAYAGALRKLGFEVETRLGTGDPARELARLANAFEAELVILGGHGHRGFSDMIYGTTVEALRHRAHGSVLVIPLKTG